MKVIVEPFTRDGLQLTAVKIELKNTTLLLIEGYDAFFMCGALDVNIYGQREVLCGKAVGVKTIEDLYQAKIADSTNYAKSQGILPGMSVHEALNQISKKE